MLYAKQMSAFRTTASVLWIIAMLAGVVFARGNRSFNKDLDETKEDDRKQCPMRELGEVIEAIASTFSEKEGGRLHVEALQNYTQFKYGGQWAVILSEYKSAVNESFHWRIPALKIRRKPAFCLKTIGYWTYYLAKVR